MEGQSPVGDKLRGQARDWKPEDLPVDRKTDVVGPPFWLQPMPQIEMPSPPVSQPEPRRPATVDFAADLARSRYALIVAEKIARDGKVEDYWSNLSRAFDERTAQAREFDELGVETPTDRAVIKDIRGEMNALIPKLAAARVNADAKSLRFTDPNMYVHILERRLEQAERTAAFSGGDEATTRTAIDEARIIKDQIRIVQKMSAMSWNEWNRLRAEGAREQAERIAAKGSVLETLGDKDIDTNPDRVELAEIQAKMKRKQAERAKLNIWNIFAKADIDKELSSMRLREAFLIRKANRKPDVPR